MGGVLGFRGEILGSLCGGQLEFEEFVSGRFGE